MKDTFSILVVDDDQEVLSLTSEVLSRGGYEVMQASTGKDALESAAQVHPDMVLLDVMLPDMSGLEVCERIKADPIWALRWSSSYWGSAYRAKRR